tara:strand:- start:38414 stop:41464 length:3051 start_codon:yes stop_codon:yes gene_type:complete
MKNRIAVVVPIVVLIGAAIYWFMPSGYCDKAYASYGFKVPECPVGSPKQIVSVWGRELKRSGDGNVEVSLEALYTTAKADEALRIPIEKYKASFFLVDAAGSQTPLPIKGKWEQLDESKRATVVLPQVDDGDYLLRTKTISKIGPSVVDMKLPLYAPARIHMLTDRPLYEPGNTVQFRALALRASDLSPIDNRPGSWIVTDPSGEVLLEEKAPAKEWGVVAGDFPLAEDAAEGTWTVAWRSGEDSQSTTFLVEPFVLPRFRVDSASDKSFYQSGDTPSVRGAVVYSSGAPVAGARLEISWSTSGAWPPPTSWIDGGELPREAKTGANGEFALVLPKIPADLRGTCNLRAYISAIDPAGDRVQASASVLLSENAIAVSAVTELEGGLVENTNNRVYLRVTDPTGSALGGATINVKRAWAPGDKGIDAELDADGVARIQFDPGRPVNVVIPAMPIRKSTRAAAGAVTLASLNEMVSGQRALADQVAIESWLADLSVCSLWVRNGAQNSRTSFRVSASGALSAVADPGSPLSSCVTNIVKTKRLPAGTDRLYTALFAVQASGLPALDAAVTTTMSAPNGLQELVQQAATEARTCLPATFEGGLPWPLFWQTSAQSKNVELSWMKSPGVTVPMPVGADRCILSKLGKLALPVEATTSALGLVRYQVSQPSRAGGEVRPQATIMQGYELSVSAMMGADSVGDTTLRMQPGAIPNLRLRATPVIANAAEEIELALYRGPDFEGDLPKEIRLSHEGKHEVIKLEKEAKGAAFTLPVDAKGWYEFRAGGARALVFVRSNEELRVSLTPGAMSYRPGESAEISIQTSIAGQGAKAAVGLFGVDKSLSQIATLRGPDDLGSVRSEISMREKAFGSLDAQALSLGRIRGANAAEATVLRVDAVPTPDAIDRVIYENAQTKFEPITVLTDNFYIALAELHMQTRAWEAAAASGETMSPKIMASLWKKTLKACKLAGTPAVDAYGRALRLHWLPSDLLALVAPAQVVADATRLPEDVENWQQWVMEEKP